MIIKEDKTVPEESEGEPDERLGHIHREEGRRARQQTHSTRSI